MASILWRYLNRKFENYDIDITALRPAVPGGIHAQEAGYHDRERRKRDKVLGHRPPHTKRRFFFV